jgi:hypothetical protein
MQYSSTKYRDLQISTDLKTISNSKGKTKSNIKETLESNIKEKPITHGINHTYQCQIQHHQPISQQLTTVPPTSTSTSPIPNTTTTQK